jgi:PAS domain-containing protein
VIRRLLRYSEGIVTLNKEVNHQYRELFVKNIELDAVVSLSYDGVLLVNAEGQVTLCNRTLEEVLSVKGDISGEPISIFDPEIKEVLSRKTGQEWIAMPQDAKL